MLAMSMAVAVVLSEALTGLMQVSLSMTVALAEA